MTAISPAEEEPAQDTTLDVFPKDNSTSDHHARSVSSVQRPLLASDEDDDFTVEIADNKGSVGRRYERRSQSTNSASQPSGSRLRSLQKNVTKKIQGNIRIPGAKKRQVVYETIDENYSYEPNPLLTERLESTECEDEGRLVDLDDITDKWTEVSAAALSSRLRYRASMEYSKGLKPQDYQVCVTVIEGRNLSGVNLEPVVCIQVGDTKKYTSSKTANKASNSPYYNEFFVFDFNMPTPLFLDQIITLTVYQTRKIVGTAPIVGCFKLDVHAVANRPDKLFYHKWAVLTDPEEPMAGPKGFIKCDISVTTKGEPVKAPPRISKDEEDDIDSNLLQPHADVSERTYARYRFRIHRAEGLPTASATLMNSVKKVFSTADANKHFIDPMLEITFAGVTAKTSSKTATASPEWNEEIVFIEQFPPLVRRIRLQLLAESINNVVIGTAFLDLATVCDQGKMGFLPTFGPCYLNFYGSVRDQSIVSDKTTQLNDGIGEGVAFRGRLLLSFNVELLAETMVLSLEPTMTPCEAITETEKFQRSVGPREDFFLFASIMDVSMLEKKLADKPVTLELSMGTEGLPETQLPPRSPEEGEAPPTRSCRSTTPPIKPVSRDQTYYYLPYERSKPCLYINSSWFDHRDRLYNSNCLGKIAEKLEQSLNDVNAGVLREAPAVELRLRMALDSFAEQCTTYLTFNEQYIHSVQYMNQYKTEGKTKLEKERLQMCKRDIQSIFSDCRALRSTLSSTNVQEKLTEAFLIADRLRMLAIEPQHSLPDVFLWLYAGGKRIGYQRFAVQDLIHSANEMECGRLCGTSQCFFLKTPGGDALSGSKQNQIQVTAYFWLGLAKDKRGYFDGLTSGYDVTSELRRSQEVEIMPPHFLYYEEVYAYQLRCHIYQARSLIGLDETGLSDPYVRVVFEGYSAATQVMQETLNPQWDELLVLNNVTLYGSAVDIKASPPPVIMQLFDFDQVNKSDYIGQSIGNAFVKLQGDVYAKPNFPPSLVWHTVYKGPEQSGEVLAAFELIQLPISDDVPALPDSDRVNDLTGPIVPIPNDIRPKLVRYRIEAMFWGLRDLKRSNIATAIDRPRVDIVISGATISSSIITNYKKNPNFGRLLKSIDVDLPEDPLYWPPVSIRVVDCKNFGRFTLLGVHTINAIDKYMFDARAAAATAVERIGHRDQTRSNNSYNDGDSRTMNSVEKTRLARAMSIPNPPEKLTKSPFSSRRMSGTKSLRRKASLTPSRASGDVDTSILDWWSKYFASAEKSIKEHLQLVEKTTTAAAPTTKSGGQKKRKKRGKEKEGVDTIIQMEDETTPYKTSGKNSSSYLSRSESLEKLQMIAAKHVKSAGQPEVATMQIFDSELERLDTFEGFTDTIHAFDLYRGKQKAIDQHLDMAARRVGCFKGALRICRHPIPSVFDKSLYQNVPNNDPINVLVRVYVVKGYDLHPADVNGKADPYVVLSLGKQVVSDKENYISKNLNPIFGKCFELQAFFPLESQLTVQVYDWDLVGMDDLIGETKIDLENRYYSRYRATCGVPQKYDNTGYNKWRDSLRPSQVLARLCKDYQLDGPFYAPDQVKVGSKTFIVPPVISSDHNPLSEQQAEEDRLALFALNRWKDIPGAGHELVPEHVETRALFNNSKPGIEQGRLEMWIDMFPMDLPAPPPPTNISPRKPKSYELRVVIWNTDEVLLEDDAFFTGEKMSDIYVKGSLKGDDVQATDVHYRSLTGEGNFNWRFVFPFDYLETEDKIVIKKKESMLSWDETEYKIPARLNLQVWDADHFSADDFLGSFTLNLTHFPRGAKSAKKCGLEMLDEHAESLPMVNLFKQRRLKGWWPFVTLDEADEPMLAGKVEAEFQLLDAEDAEKSPVGLGRNEPEPLEKPNRPDTSFMWFMNPLKSMRYILWHNYKWLILKILFLVLFILLLLLFIYNTPGYMVKRLLGA